MFKLLLLFFMPIFLCAQQTKIITKEIDDTGIKQVYSVIDFSEPLDIKDINKKIYPEIMHGSFQTFYHDTLLAEGFYKFGMKDSLWKEYNPKNGTLSSSGNYYYDVKDGWWIYNSKAGIPVRKVNEVAKETIILDSVLYNEENEYKVYQSCEVPPKFIGGEDKLMEFLGTNIRYPLYAKEHNIQGRVYATFVIDRSGKITNAKILRGIGGGCDEEALRVVNLMNSNNSWRPGYQNGQAVLVQYNLPIVFNLKN